MPKALSYSEFHREISRNNTNPNFSGFKGDDRPSEKSTLGDILKSFGSVTQRRKVLEVSVAISGNPTSLTESSAPSLSAGTGGASVAWCFYYYLHRKEPGTAGLDDLDRMVLGGLTFAEMFGQHVDGRSLEKETVDESAKQLDSRSEVQVSTGEKKFFGSTYQIVAIGCSIVLVVGVIALNYFASHSSSDGGMTEADRREQLDRAHDVLSRTVTGNSGKGTALSTLMFEERSISGLNLSCDGMGGLVDGRCKFPAVINDVRLGEASALAYNCNSEVNQQDMCGDGFGTSPGYRSMRDSSFSGAKASLWDVNDVFFEAVDFSNVEANRWFFRNARFRNTTWEGFSCYGCIFEDMTLPTELFLGLDASYVSGVNVWFDGTENLTGYRQLYAHIDNPPIFFSRTAADILKDNTATETTTDDLIVWDLYRHLSFCLPFENLGEYIDQNFDPTQFRSVAGDTYPIPDSTIIIRTKDERPHVCGVPFSEVEAYLRRSFLMSDYPSNSQIMNERGLSD